MAFRTKLMPKGGQRSNPEEWARKPIAVNMRGSAEWKEWVEELARFDRAAVSDLVDRALTKYARSIGFEKPPPER